MVSSYDISTPPTFGLFRATLETAADASLAIDGALQNDGDIVSSSYPHLLKPNAGGFGAGIQKVLNRGVLDTIHSLSSDQMSLYRQYVSPASNKIYRVWFLMGKVQCAVERTVEPEDDNQFQKGCSASGLCSFLTESSSGADKLVYNTAPISSYDVPMEVISEVEELLLPLLEDAHTGSVEFLITPSDGRRVYFDINMLSTLPLESHLFNSDPWRELAEAIARLINGDA
jgi:hypothetical protein